MFPMSQEWCTRIERFVDALEKAFNLQSDQIGELLRSQELLIRGMSVVVKNTCGPLKIDERAENEWCEDDSNNGFDSDLDEELLEEDDGAQPCLPSRNVTAGTRWFEGRPVRTLVTCHKRLPKSYEMNDEPLLAPIQAVSYVPQNDAPSASHTSDSIVTGVGNETVEHTDVVASAEVSMEPACQPEIALKEVEEAEEGIDSDETDTAMSLCIDEDDLQSQLSDPATAIEPELEEVPSELAFFQEDHQMESPDSPDMELEDEIEQELKLVIEDEQKSDQPVTSSSQLEEEDCQNPSPRLEADDQSGEQLQTAVERHHHPEEELADEVLMTASEEVMSTRSEGDKVDDPEQEPAPVLEYYGPVEPPAEEEACLDLVEEVIVNPSHSSPDSLICVVEEQQKLEEDDLPVKMHEDFVDFIEESISDQSRTAEPPTEVSAKQPEDERSSKEPLPDVEKKIAITPVGRSSLVETSPERYREPRADASEDRSRRRSRSKDRSSRRRRSRSASLRRRRRRSRTPQERRYRRHAYDLTPTHRREERTRRSEDSVRRNEELERPKTEERRRSDERTGQRRRSRQRSSCHTENEPDNMSRFERSHQTDDDSTDRGATTLMANSATSTFETQATMTNSWQPITSEPSPLFFPTEASVFFSSEPNRDHPTPTFAPHHSPMPLTVPPLMSLDVAPPPPPPPPPPQDTWRTETPNHFANVPIPQQQHHIFDDTSFVYPPPPPSADFAPSNAPVWSRDLQAEQRNVCRPPPPQHHPNGCVYCHEEQHGSRNCPNVLSRSDRERILSNERRCFLCLSVHKGCSVKDCYRRSRKRCSHCHSHQHDRSVCPHYVPLFDDDDLRRRGRI